MKGMIRLSVITLLLLVMMLMFVSCKSTENRKLEAQKIEYLSQINGLQIKYLIILQIMLLNLVRLLKI